MKNHQAQLSLVLDSISDGVVVVGDGGKVLYANFGAEKIFDRGCLLGKELAIPTQPSELYQEINLLRPKGIGWAEFRSANITWENKPAFVISLRDISERKSLEDRLHLADAVFESATEGLLVTDVNHRIIRVNRAFTEITGYTPEDVIGKSSHMLRSGRHDESFYSLMRQSLDIYGRWHGEIWNRRKNGEVYPELLSISTIKNEHGVVLNYVGVFADITKIKKSEQELEFLAQHDPLTHLPNRIVLLSRLQHALERHKRDRTHLALLMLDLDRFKDVNDSFGHLSGDELLKMVAERLQYRLREMDTVCRLGGDEFVVMLENIEHTDVAARVAMNLIEEMGKPWKLPNGAEVRIGCSIGISVFPDHGATPELLLQHADSALYQAKADGRGRFTFFSNDLTLAARDRLDLEIRLRNAIDKGELQLYLQPQLEINGGRVLGAEALVRWLDPTEGLIYPNRFIGVAEQVGLISEIDTWVLRETCIQGRRWLDAGLPKITLAVNVSPYQFSQVDICEIVRTVLEETKYPPELLELELTETALMKREQEAIETLNRLKAIGVRLAIDDFGTGYSSLAYLKLFPIDVLKIDKKFIDDVPIHRDDMEIVSAVIGLGHTLHLKVLAEGVENSSQLEFLKSLRCDQYQGYLASRPIPASEFEIFLTKSQHQG